MKRRNSQLGKVFHTCENYEDLVQQLHDEAGVVGKKVEEVMKVFDLRNGYDREVMMIMITNRQAMATLFLRSLLAPSRQKPTLSLITTRLSFSSLVAGRKSSGSNFS